MSMIRMREQVFGALSRLVRLADDTEQFDVYLTQLSQDHRRYGVREQHYLAFFAALLETVAHFNADRWTPGAEESWAGLLEHAARTMRSAASTDAEHHPPWWTGEVVAHEQRTDTVAVLTIQPDQPLPYTAGQYVPVQVARWPRVRRPYSIANAPRPDGRIDLHVRAVPGGIVSTTLVRHTAPGDTVILGAPRGEMVPSDDERDLLCVAGGTGLAPIKAIVEATAREGRPRKITLFTGARRQEDLYDLADLRQLQTVVPGLQVIPVLSEEDALTGVPWRTGLLPGVVRGHGLFEHCRAYISGPEAMVRQTALLLAAHLPANCIQHDPLPAAPARFPAEPAPELSRLSLYAKFGSPLAVSEP